MATGGQVYQGYLIWRDATRWVLRMDPWGDQPGEDTATGGVAVSTYLKANCIVPSERSKPCLHLSWLTMVAADRAQHDDIL